MSNQKRKHAGSDSDPYSSSPPSVEGNSIWPVSVQEENTKKLKLYFQMNVAEHVYTSNNLVGDGGDGIQIRLIDAETNQTITTGIESSVKVYFVVINGSFNREGRENWSPEEFYRCIVKGREHKALLTGDLEVALKQGVGFIHKLTFKDNSSWIPDRKLRIGVCVSSGYCDGTRIREAFTEPFTVLHNRGKLNEKHHPPKSSDDVWRLEGIGKGGPFHKSLKDAGIDNVEKFLLTYNKDPEELKSILGKAMTATKWNPQTCPANGKWLVYYSGNASNYAPLFNNFARVTGFIWNGVIRAINSLSDEEKAEADWLVKLAHKNWEEVTEYGIVPFHESEAVPPGNHDRILVGSSISQDHPAEISHQDHPESSSFWSQGFSIQPNAMTNSGVAAEHASTSQQAVPAVETSKGPQPDRISSPLHIPFFSDPGDGCYADEFFPEMKWDQ